MTTSADDRQQGATSAPPTAPAAARRLRAPFALVASVVLLLLHGVPWWLLVLAPDWPWPATLAGTAVALIAVAGFPVAMVRGHGRRHRDGFAIVADTWLGIVWQLFAWSLIGGVAELVLQLFGVPGPGRERGTAIAVLLVVIVLCCWGAFQARRVPRVRRTEITLDGLGAGLDGATIALLADTHYGPIDRTRWSARTVEALNRLHPDVVVHAGDLADGSVAQRRAQVAPLGSARAALARVYITGNHEYYSGATAWVEHMAGLGWTVLHNRHVVVERGGDHLVLAGIDDLTAAGSGVPGHRADLSAALAGRPAGAPVVLIAHQPKQVAQASQAGVDLQLSGHTHGGQIWPFHLLVRAEQGTLHGLSRRGATQLYTTRGAGFWGPPFRVFAPSEISLLTLRAPRS